MTDAEYHAHPAWSASRLKLAVTGTMLDYWAREEAPERVPFMPTDDMRQGSLVDCLLTELANFDAKYAVLPENAPKKPTATQLKAKKPSVDTLLQMEWWDNFQAENIGKEIINAAWLANALSVIERLRSDPHIGPILAKPRSSQVPHFWTDEQGRECRYKPDIETTDGELWDLKKTRSANPRLFRAQSYSLAYDLQVGGHYRLGFTDRHGAEPVRSGIIAFEWKWPHNCSLLVADDEFIEMGLERRELAFSNIAECKKTGNWPSYGEAILSPPSYADLNAADDDTDLSDLGLEGLDDAL